MKDYCGWTMKYCYFDLYKRHVLYQGIHTIIQSTHVFWTFTMVYSPNKQTNKKCSLKAVLIRSAHSNVWRSHRLRDLDFHDRRCAERRRPSIASLDHHRPPAVFLFGDVLHDLHRLDVRFEPNLSCGGVNVEDVVWIGFHDGIFNQVIGFLRVLIHSLETNQNQVIS